MYIQQSPDKDFWNFVESDRSSRILEMGEDRVFFERGRKDRPRRLLGHQTIPLRLIF